jgi:hypothetical protein
MLHCLAMHMGTSLVFVAIYSNSLVFPVFLGQQDVGPPGGGMIVLLRLCSVEAAVKLCKWLSPAVTCNMLQ